MSIARMSDSIASDSAGGSIIWPTCLQSGIRGILSNLSNDEILTPRDIANQVLDYSK